MKNKTICLNMIVKNESAVIRRSIGSVKHKIDYWVIVDTGSTDGTQQIIQEFLQDIPGELHERPWVNIEKSRNEALDLARNKCDYILVIDADEEWVFAKDFQKKNLNKDFYVVLSRDQNIDLHRISLINSKLRWKWKGIIHEELQCEGPISGGLLEGITNHGWRRDGHQNTDPKRYYKDAAALEKALEEDPTNARYIFFLAQSYGAAKELHLALTYYKKRAEMGGFEPEIFWSLFSVGCLQEDLHMDEELAIQSYCKAFEFDSTRAEPLHHLAKLYQKKENHALAYILAKFALSLPQPKALHYVLRAVYDYSLLFTYACSAHCIRQFEEAKKSYYTLLTKPSLPEGIKTVIEHNLKLLSQ